VAKNRDDRIWPETEVFSIAKSVPTFAFLDRGVHYLYLFFNSLGERYDSEHIYLSLFTIDSRRGDADAILKRSRSKCLKMKLL
jgi:hypothetical protein